VKCSLSGLSVLGVGAQYGFLVCWYMFLSRRFAGVLRLVSFRFINLDSRSVVSRLYDFVGGLSGLRVFSFRWSVFVVGWAGGFFVVGWVGGIFLFCGCGGGISASALTIFLLCLWRVGGISADADMKIS